MPVVLDTRARDIRDLPGKFSILCRSMAITSLLQNVLHVVYSRYSDFVKCNERAQVRHLLVQHRLSP